jgi:polyhydroxybutyrate depolymerase
LLASFRRSKIVSAAMAALTTLTLTSGMPVTAAPSNEGGYHPAVPTDLVSRIPFNAQNRKYLVHLPPSYDGRTAMPLVICLHGGGGDFGFAKRMFGMNEKADKEGFIVAYPNGSGRLKNHILTWNAGECCGYAEARRIDDVTFIRNFIRQMRADYNIDSKRVYLVGFSLGGMMAYRLACELTDDLTAIAVVGGSMNGKEKVPSRAVPVLIIHGLADRHVPIQGGGGKLAKWGFNVHAKPLDYAISYWVNHNGCDPTPKVEKQGIVERRTYAGGKDGAEVAVVTIEGYRHSWPGGNRAWPLADPPCPVFSATDACWNFFAKHERIDESQLADKEQPEKTDQPDLRAAVKAVSGT